jgi:endonuclease YncB( thermonuclease family)
VYLRVALACAFTVLLAAQAAADDRPACATAAIGTALVRSVIDERTAQLSDGRELRLAGIEAPASAKALLETLISGRDVSLRKLGTDSDRYGRVVALVTVLPDNGGASVQQALLARGQARVLGNIADKACTEAFLDAEKAARAAGLGLWSDPHYVTRNAENPEGILTVRGRFAVVEGKVLSVRESGGTIYVNFGRRWSEDFTVTVLKRNERTFAAAGLELKKLAGQRVRVRGTVEERGGPWIEATRPGQIEIAERN